ncbi:MAG: hypothetical protein KQI78_03580 [Deltaproteobacteria bacterium]|nr:hypothetical protein [Deltaproteobacteria bacterium]
MTLQFNAYVLYYWWGGAALGVWLQQQLPESIGFAIQAVLMLVSAVLILLGIVATFTAEEP